MIELVHTLFESAHRTADIQADKAFLSGGFGVRRTVAEADFLVFYEEVDDFLARLAKDAEIYPDEVGPLRSSDGNIRHLLFTKLIDIIHVALQILVHLVHPCGAMSISGLAGKFGEDIGGRGFVL